MVKHNHKKSIPKLTFKVFDRFLIKIYKRFRFLTDVKNFLKLAEENYMHKNPLFSLLGLVRILYQRAPKARV